MKDRIKLAVIGLGQRGFCMLKNPIIPMKEDGIDVVAVCDPLEDRLDEAVKALLESGAEKPFATTNYNEVLSLKELDAVYIAVSWESHVEVAVAAMKAGKYNVLV